jgi:hypothetical protein
VELAEDDLTDNFDSCGDCIDELKISNDRCTSVLLIEVTDPRKQPAEKATMLTIVNLRY